MKNREIAAPLYSFLTNCQSIFLQYQGGTDEKKIITPGAISVLLDKCPPKLPSKFPNVPSIRLKYARITNPHKDTAIEQVLRFYANLPHGVPLEFELYNVTDPSAVRVKTVYPDGKNDVMKPRNEEFRKEDDHLAVSTQVFNFFVLKFFLIFVFLGKNHLPHSLGRRR